MKLSFILIFFAFVLVLDRLGAAPSSIQKKIDQMEINAREFSVQKKSLEKDILSLDETQLQLSGELLQFESGLKDRLKSLVVPLLSWPERIFTKESSSWTEFQRSQMLLRELKAKMVAEPLRLIADRDLKIQELKTLRQDLEQKVTQLQSKEELLNLQMEELKLLESRSKVRLPAATARKKKDIGDILSPKVD